MLWRPRGFARHERGARRGRVPLGVAVEGVLLGRRAGRKGPRADLLDEEGHGVRRALLQDADHVLVQEFGEVVPLGWAYCTQSSKASRTVDSARSGMVVVGGLLWGCSGFSASAL